VVRSVHLSRIRWVFIVAGIVLSSNLFAQSNRVTLVARFYQPHSISPSGTAYSALWGWVAPDGHEYALLGACGGTSIVDLDSEPLREVAFIPGPETQICYREIKTYKQYAYVVSEGGSGVQIIDLSGLPQRATLVKEFRYTQPGTGYSILTSHTITQADGYLYLNGSSHWDGAGVLIFSLRNDPTTPEYVGEFQPEYVHDSYVRNDTMYAASILAGGGLHIVDVRDKSNPRSLGKIVYAGSGTHNAWASLDGRYAFTTDEINSTPKTMKVWDLSQLPNSVKVAEYVAEPGGVIHNVRGRGRYVYVAHYASGMRVVDVHDPRNPVEVGFFDTSVRPTGGYIGCWDVYPYFSSGRWIGSDMDSGLFVCRFDGLAPRSTPRLLAPSNASTANGRPMFRWTAAAKQSDDPHTYELRLNSSQQSYGFRTRDTLFQPATVLAAGTYEWSVAVVDEFTEVHSPDAFSLQISSTTGNVLGRLEQNAPNPVLRRTSIPFVIGEPEVVSLTVYNMLGQKVGILIDQQPRGAGWHEVELDASQIPSGVYFYRLSTDRFEETRKLIILR
jgi:choice-of-anchor B domain-containing protein